MWPIGKRHVLAARGFRARAGRLLEFAAAAVACYDEGEPMKANSASILTRAASTEDRAGLTRRIT